VRLATTVRLETHARRVTIDSPLVRARRVTTVPHVMIEPLGQTGRIGLRATSLPSAMDDPFAKDATSMPRVSLTVPFERHETSDAMTVQRGTRVPFVTIAPRAMIAPRVTTVSRGTRVPFAMIVPLVTTAVRFAMTDRRAMTAVRRGMIAPRVPIAFHETRVPFAPTVRPGMTVPHVTTVSLATIVPHVATRTFTRRVMKRRSTSPATMSYSIACRH
jgi:hypothetical protein